MGPKGAGPSKMPKVSWTKPAAWAKRGGALGVDLRLGQVLQRAVDGHVEVPKMRGLVPVDRQRGEEKDDLAREPGALPDAERDGVAVGEAEQLAQIAVVDGQGALEAD